MKLRVLLVSYAVAVVYADTSCFLEPGFSYESLWNETALRICPGVERSEKVCIVGGGSSGVHLGWALKRRGFEPVVFERNGRLGGEVWTRHRVPNPEGVEDDDDVTRELGAAFLSPDYDEVRALLQRYNQSEQPLSAVTEMRFHAHYLEGSERGAVQFTAEGVMVVGGDGTANGDDNGGGGDDEEEEALSGNMEEHAVSPSEWAAHWTAKITNTTDQATNDALVAAALDAYVALHVSIFGDLQQNRFPPEPDTQRQLDLFAHVGGLEFLVAHGLAVLQPTFYQFFVLQGMGRLDAMPAYYLLKWVNPTTLQAGGFGNDPTTPLAMLPLGYGSLVDALANEVVLGARLNTTVVRVQRRGVTPGFDTTNGNGSKPVRLTVRRASPTPGGGGEEEASELQVVECDLLVLSGPITEFVRGSEDGSRLPILDPPTAEEVALFSPKKPMQFLVSLLDLEQAPTGFEALDFWPANFQTAGGVIVHRDVAYAEEGRSHAVGGLQSYSYHPWPRCDEAKHVASQALWLARQNLTEEAVLARAYFDTYLFHYDAEGIAQRKPWKLAASQQPFSGPRTVYVGGTAGYETVEDSLQFNLELLATLFDGQDGGKGDRSGTPLENISAAAAKQKQQQQQQQQPGSSPRRSQTKAAAAVAAAAAARAAVEYDEYGWPSEGSSALTPRLEQLAFTLACEDVRKFADADDVTWSAFLATQKGFVRKTTLVEPGGEPDENCTVWSVVQWSSLELWKTIDPTSLEAVQAAFEKAFGDNPPPPDPTPYPPNQQNGQGLEQLLDVPLPIDEPFPARARWQQQEPEEKFGTQGSGGAEVPEEGVSSHADEQWGDGGRLDSRQEPPSSSSSPAAWASSQVVEVIRSTVQSSSSSPGCTDEDVRFFVAADNATWSAFLSTQAGFVRKLTLAETSDPDSNSTNSSSPCFVWTQTMWSSLKAYRSVDSAGAAATEAAFEALLGYAPALERFPEGFGYYEVLLEREMPRGPRSAVLGGVDVVAFQHPTLLVGGVDHDVRGSPSFAVTLAAAELLPPHLLALHPRPFEFWFSSSENAALFSGDPLRYAPAVGGHCTHGFATFVDGIGLRASQVVDGRLGFVCVNTTQWGQVLSDGRLYLNSCGMYGDFMLDPEGDAAKANKQWAAWFGPWPNATTKGNATKGNRSTAASFVGPFNDACVQNGATWGGPPHYTDGLLPPQCNII